MDRLSKTAIMKRNKTVEEFLEKQKEYREELEKLREIILDAGLEETTKWGAPTYTYQGKNVVGLGAFKSYFGLWFFQGALLDDKKKKLMNAQEGVTKAMRQWRFESAVEINEKLIKEYIKESVQNIEEGREIKPARKKPLSVPPELRKALEKSAELESRFNDLNLTKKRDFAEYISSAKRDETKRKRLEKIIPMIREGIGLNDKYK